jgi:putative transposase
VTYVPTVQGWLYLACVTDVFSRMVIGWSMAAHRRTDLVVDAVAMAVHRRGGHVPGVIHHSDRGGEYSSHALERELRRHGTLASMGSVADCFDNALTESVFATLECELVDLQPGGRFATRREAKLAVLDYLETFYNPRRRHSALGQIAPATFEAGTLPPPRPEPQTAEARCPRQRVNSTQPPRRHPARGRRAGLQPGTSPTPRTAPPLTAGFTAGTAA